ncbi:MAG: ABC transporter ATP-binding protein [Candidatus Marinimicrobia bacterium]|nr:ABC transporter ATP-binding protein [Candidatus Neomarinimicrobiota bacterium]
MESKYIVTEGLSKDYGKLRALAGVDLELRPGRIVGLLGKNGAGKSTLLKSLLGLLRYEGRVEVLGRDLKDWKQDLYGRVAFIPDVSGLDPRLTVAQTLAYASGVNANWDAEKSQRLFSGSGLPAEQKVGTLSKGMKTKLYLLLTLSRDADILLLDEPTLGLDIVFRKSFYDMLLGEYFEESKLVLVSTHQVSELENILDEVIFIDGGRILLHSPVAELKERWRRIELPASREEELRGMKVRQISRGLGKVQGLVEGEVKVRDAHIGIATLSEIFLAVLNEGGQGS